MNEKRGQLNQERIDAYHKLQGTYITDMNEELFLISLRIDYLENRYVDINHLLGARSHGDNLIVITEEYGKEMILARDFLMVTGDVGYEGENIIELIKIVDTIYDREYY
ncbi:hypothetical protein [Rummeliibacillus sp. TYF-LIM-RU47]|uniref:hypothetical protein n=1 Tax=Rummeliibacillus sp. TYF-LIM-RU47 TaxID=2608406 RepID=UPI00123AD95E|nr:hypothetical protein [Rummeliibacillus sp. TYF-LIM-RU47]